MGLGSWLSALLLKLTAAERENLSVRVSAARDTATKTLSRRPLDAARRSYVITNSKDEDWGVVSQEAARAPGQTTVRPKTQRSRKGSG